MIKSIIIVFAIAISTITCQSCPPTPVQQNFDSSKVRTNVKYVN